VPVQATNDPQTFTFKPPGAEATRLYRVSAKADDPACPDLDALVSSYWLPGNQLEVTFAPRLNTQLRTLQRGTPVHQCDDPAGSGEFPGCWGTDEAIYGTLKERKQEFKWETQLKGAAKAKLQASLWPFPSDFQGDMFSPPGLVATWDVSPTCSNCAVDLSPLAFPASKAETESTGTKSTPETWLEKGITVIQTAFQAVGDLVLSVGRAIAELSKVVLEFFGGSVDEKPEAVQVDKATVPMGTIKDNLANIYYVPSTFYFRLVPLDESGNLAGGASNTVRIDWAEKTPWDEKLGEALKCLQTPTPAGCPTPTPAPPKAYIAEIVSYNGIIPPTKNKSCFIVTEDTTKHIGSIKLEYKAGSMICEPEPKEPSCSITDPVGCVEVVVGALSDGWDWIGEVWSDLKGFVIQTFLKVTQLGSLCDKVGIASECEMVVKGALDAGLLALGIPPNIPSFDQLVNEGVDYLAAQAASQIAIPPDVVKAATEIGGPLAGLALAEAEAKLREEAESAIRDNVQKQMEKVQYSYADNVGWLPKGVPVRPDPTSWVQPPMVRVKITRNPAVAESPGSCQLQIFNWVKNDFTQPGVTIPQAAKEWLKPGTDSPIYNQEYLPLPPLKPGESVVLPVVLTPNTYSYWLKAQPKVQMYWTLEELWYAMYHGGTVTMFASGPCVENSFLTAPAQSGGAGPAS
jgi:hypothetical protein